MNLQSYYLNYLGKTDSKSEIFISEQRTKPVNKKYYYKIIFSEKERVCSVSPEYFGNYLIAEIKNHRDSIYNLYNELKSQYTNEMVRIMYRMTITPHIINDEKEELFNIGNIKYIPEIYKYMMTDKRGNLISYAKFSDIDFGGANIVVWTDELYRRRGIGKLLVKKLLTLCNEHSFTPIYLVDEKNTASIRLAKSIGFKLFSKELIVST